jgi:DNA-binding MarR family transcriptional regulator
MEEVAQKRKSRWDISKRWTPALVLDGFTPIPAAFLEHYGPMGITSSEAMLIVHLMSHKWDEKNPFPTFGRIAARMRVSETAVRGHARNLEKKKFLKRIKRPGRSNEFDLTPLFERLEKMQAFTKA